jgi:hypothetical protein
MGQACPALRESEFSGSALGFGVLNHKSQATNYKKISNSKLQIPNRFNAQRRRLRRVLLFVCFLGFVIWNFNKSMNF